MILLCCPYIGCIKSFKVNIPNHPAFSWQICWFPEVCVWDKLESLSFLGRSKEGHKFSLFTSTVLLHTGIIDTPSMVAETRARSCWLRFLPSWEAIKFSQAFSYQFIGAISGQQIMNLCQHSLSETEKISVIRAKGRFEKKCSSLRKTHGDKKCSSDDIFPENITKMQ